jgi:hypothetical protein
VCRERAQPIQIPTRRRRGLPFQAWACGAVVLLRAGSRTERSPSIPATPAVRAVPPQPQPAWHLRLLRQVCILVSLRDLVSVWFLLEVRHAGVGDGNRRFQKKFPPNGWWDRGSSVLPFLGHSRMRVILFFARRCPDCSLISRFVVFNARAMRQV